MPVIFRSMLLDDEKPKIGPTAKTLGVRTGGNRPDIAVDSSGNVNPGTGGMSVAPDWKDLPLHRVPERLAERLKEAGRLGDARGREKNLFCWRLGTGGFVEGTVAENLQLRIDKPTHDVVEPSEVMPIDAFQAVLAATQGLWQIDES